MNTFYGKQGFISMSSDNTYKASILTVYYSPLIVGGSRALIDDIEYEFVTYLKNESLNNQFDLIETSITELNRLAGTTKHEGIVFECLTEEYIKTTNNDIKSLKDISTIFYLDIQEHELIEFILIQLKIVGFNHVIVPKNFKYVDKDVVNGLTLSKCNYWKHTFNILKDSHQILLLQQISKQKPSKHIVRCGMIPKKSKEGKTLLQKLFGVSENQLIVISDNEYRTNNMELSRWNDNLEKNITVLEFLEPSIKLSISVSWLIRDISNNRWRRL